MATQKTELVLETSGGAKVKQDLEAVGAAGERAFKRVRDAAKDVPTHLRAVDAAASDVRKRAASLASELGPLGSALKAIGPLAVTGGAAFVALAGGFTLLAKRAIDSASALKDQAARVGVSVEKFQELAFVGRQVGVSGEQLGGSLEKLAANLGKARDGSGTLAKYLKGTDSAFLSTLQHANDTGKAFDLLVGFISKLPTEMEQAAAAVAAFGKGGTALLPILQEGPKGIAAMAAQARRLGIILDTQLINQADDAGDKLQLLADVVKGNLNRALLSAAPQIAEVARLLAEGAAAGARFAASIGIGKLSPAMRLEDIKNKVRELRKEQAAGEGTNAPQNILDTPQNQIDALREEAKRIRAQMEADDKAEQERLKRRQKGVEDYLKQQEQERDAEDASKKAANEAEAAEKRRASQRKQALEEIARLQEDAAKAGLDGIALVEKERDQAYAHWAELAKQGLITEEEAAQAYLAAWQEAEGKKQKIVETANEKAAAKADKANEKAAEHMLKPFENALESVQEEFGKTFETILKTGKFSFETLADDAISIFTDLAVQIANAWVASNFFQPLIDQAKQVPGQLPASMGGTQGGVGQSPTQSALGMAGGGIETIGGIAKALGLGGEPGSGFAMLMQGAGGILGILNAILGKGGTFGKVLSGGLGVNALANTVGMGVSIVPTTAGGLGIQVAGNTLLTVGTSGITLGADAFGTTVTTTSTIAAQAAAVDAGAAGAGGGLGAGTSAAISAVAWVAAAAAIAYIAAESSKAFVQRRDPTKYGEGFGNLYTQSTTPNFVRAAIYAKNGQGGRAALSLFDPGGVSEYTMRLAGFDPFHSIPTKEDILGYLAEDLTKGLATTTGGQSIYGPTAGLGRRGRQALRGLRGNTDLGFLIELATSGLSRGVLNAPGAPDARRYPGEVPDVIRDILRGGAARAQGAGGDAVTFLGKLVRQLYDFGPALKLANEQYLKHDSLTLQAGKTTADFTAKLALLVEIFGNRLPKGIDATRVAAKVLEDQGYATKRAVLRAGLLESRDRAEREGTLVLDPQVTAGRLRGLRARARAGLFDAQDIAVGSIDQVRRELAALTGGPRVAERQAFGAIQTAFDRLNIARKAKDFEALGQAVTGAVDAVKAWGQTVVNLVDAIRAIDRQLEDFKLTSVEETDALRKNTSTAKIYNDLLVANAARFDRLARTGGSAAAQLDTVNRQLDLLRRQAAAQRTDVQERLAAEQKLAQARSEQISPLAGIAGSARAQLDALLIGSKSTPAAQLAEVQAQLARAQGQFRSATGENQAAAAARVLDLVNQSLTLGGAALGPASQRFLGLRRAGIGAVGEVTTAAEAAARELHDLIERSTLANEAAEKELEAIDAALADQLDAWNAKIVPLLEAQRGELVTALQTALPGADLEALLADPQAAQLLVAGQQLTMLTSIRDAINAFVNKAEGRSGVTVNVTVTAPTDGNTAAAQLYARTTGDAIGSRIVLGLANGGGKKVA